MLAQAQPSSGDLVIGNVSRVCFPDSAASFQDTLPATLDSFNTIYLFSNASSNFSESDIENIENFLVEGGGLYMGSDNWPLQAESNQITRQFYQKETFGNYDVEVAQTNTKGNLRLSETDTVPAGTTTSAFPLDYRLTVEAWVEDQPLILTGRYGEGNLVIDTGYSRFYCDQRNANTDLLLLRISEFLRKEEESNTD